MTPREDSFFASAAAKATHTCAPSCALLASDCGRSNQRSRECVPTRHAHFPHACPLPTRHAHFPHAFQLPTRHAPHPMHEAPIAPAPTARNRPPNASSSTRSPLCAWRWSEALQRRPRRGLPLRQRHRRQRPRQPPPKAGNGRRRETCGLVLASNPFGRCAGNKAGWQAAR
eukprot:207144-Chlamydomonas_euryale.AAC.9